MPDFTYIKKEKQRYHFWSAGSGTCSFSQSFLATAERRCLSRCDAAEPGCGRAWKRQLGMFGRRFAGKRPSGGDMKAAAN